ncbi:hypothetical protein ABW21_db0204085 [Orbilia brochopaga]|nr:hypothetical protein ABW21_db0204085 [Drechslerella brochopaga]
MINDSCKQSELETVRPCSDSMPSHATRLSRHTDEPHIAQSLHERHNTSLNKLVRTIRPSGPPDTGLPHAHSKYDHPKAQKPMLDLGNIMYRSAASCFKTSIDRLSYLKNRPSLETGPYSSQRFIGYIRLTLYQPSS